MTTRQGITLERANGPFAAPGLWIATAWTTAGDYIERRFMGYTREEMRREMRREAREMGARIAR